MIFCCGPVRPSSAACNTIFGRALIGRSLSLFTTDRCGRPKVLRAGALRAQPRPDDARYFADIASATKESLARPPPLPGLPYTFAEALAPSSGGQPSSPGGGLPGSAAAASYYTAGGSSVGPGVQSPARPGSFAQRMVRYHLPLPSFAPEAHLTKN